MKRIMEIMNNDQKKIAVVFCFEGICVVFFNIYMNILKYITDYLKLLIISKVAHFAVPQN